MNRSNKIPEGRKRGNVAHSLPLRNEVTCHISYLDLILLTSVVCLRTDMNMYTVLLADSKYTDLGCNLLYLDLA